MLSVVALRSLCVACDCALWSCANNTSATRQNELKTRIFFIFVLRPLTMITRPTAKRFRTKVTNPLGGPEVTFDCCQRTSILSLGYYQPTGGTPHDKHV